MDCLAAGPYLGTLYDGEDVPEEAVKHITACVACRARLREHAAISSEFRILAAAETQKLRPLSFPATLPAQSRAWFRFDRSVRVPRFALVMAIAVIVGLSVALGYVE